VTNVGLAHAEFFNSADEVALAKRELIEALPPDGVAVLNADDPRVSRFREVHRGCVVSFGFEESADVRPERVDYRPEGVRFVVDGVEFESVLVGRHGVMNVLAGIAVARVFGIPAGRLVDAVRAVEPGQMRGRRLVRRGITIFDDCYNSNPEAVRSMLDVLRQAPARRRIAVLGEMLELGRFAEPLHRDVGRYVAACGMNVLVGIRGAARHLVEEAVRSGMPAGAAFFFEDPAAAGVFLRRALQEGDAVLFKGSRGTQVEKALEGVVE
jgi:UDP-N-acetylmuramoyl-tripeptide--D-alanyl-D-alanine ligase